MYHAHFARFAHINRSLLHVHIDLQIILCTHLEDRQYLYYI